MAFTAMSHFNPPTKQPFMNELLFRPDDVLFFRDARPMGGASSGQGARFPEPHVLNSALHAACHRAFAEDPTIGHSHGYRDRQRKRRDERTERFGSLRTAGPFPVDKDDRWYFPLPLDLPRPQLGVRLAPVDSFNFAGSNSLTRATEGCLLPLGTTLPPSKDQVPEWIERSAFEAYLRGESPADTKACCRSDRFFSAEHTIGIALDPENATAIDGQIYSKAQMRFREDHRLGAIFESVNHRGEDADLAAKLFPAANRISLGGEARQCSVTSRPVTKPPLPVAPQIEGTRVKWVLLSPAIFPYLPVSRNRLRPHPGGWLPSWINEGTYRVELLDGPGGKKATRLGQTPGKPIGAKLVAACIGKPLVISGWAQAVSEAAPDEEKQTGAKATHLAVPAGSVYYFEADTPGDARKLADALNWHGPTEGSEIRNRRSTLLGEKGYGLGLCAPWQPFGQ
jgi:CRISPR-associated protein Cmr3